jgi:hypothetical protein
LRIHIQLPTGKEEHRVEIVQGLGVEFELLLGQHFGIGANRCIPQAGFFAQTFNRGHGMRYRLVTVSFFCTEH